MHSRRDILKHSAAVAALLGTYGFLPAVQAAPAAHKAGAFDAKSMADVLKALGAKAPALSTEVSIQGPDIAENGAVVPLGVATGLSGVKQMLLLVEKNPSALAALFNVTADVEPNFSSRVKMGQSSNVYAVAILEDGRVLYAQKEVKVTLGGCGG